MAPEVFMRTKAEGHGRAADIWSVGCVIIEMSTGIVSISFSCTHHLQKLQCNSVYRDLGQSWNRIIRSCSKWVWVKHLQHRRRWAKKANSSSTVFFATILKSEPLLPSCSSIPFSKSVVEKMNQKSISYFILTDISGRWCAFPCLNPPGAVSWRLIKYSYGADMGVTAKIIKNSLKL